MDILGDEWACPSRTSYRWPWPWPSRQKGAVQPSVMIARCGSIAWKKTRSTRPVAFVRMVWKMARTHEPWTFSLENGVTNESCSVMRLTLRFFAESAL